jgi:peptidoglycan/LPS O-acetylase OafA/YrhL
MFIPLNFDAPAPFFGYNFLYPAWTLTYELLFYSIFVIAICFSHAKRGLIASAAILFLVVTLQLISNKNVALDFPASTLYAQDIQAACISNVSRVCLWHSNFSYHYKSKTK